MKNFIEWSKEYVPVILFAIVIVGVVALCVFLMTQALPSESTPDQSERGAIESKVIVSNVELSSSLVDVCEGLIDADAIIIERLNTLELQKEDLKQRLITIESVLSTAINEGKI